MRTIVLCQTGREREGGEGGGGIGENNALWKKELKWERMRMRFKQE